MYAFPPEVLVHIFEYVGDYLVLASMTCRLWRGIAWIHFPRQWCLSSRRVMAQAVSDYDLFPKLLVWLFEQNVEFDERAELAVINRECIPHRISVTATQSPLMRFLLQNKIQFRSKALYRAMLSDDIYLVKFLASHGSKLNQIHNILIREIASAGCYHLLEIILERIGVDLGYRLIKYGIDPSKLHSSYINALDGVVFGEQIDLLPIISKYTNSMHLTYFPIADVHNILGSAKMSIIQWVANNCSSWIRADLYYSAVGHGNIELLNFLNERCICNHYHTWMTAIASDKLESLDWLYKHIDTSRLHQAIEAVGTNQIIPMLPEVIKWLQDRGFLPTLKI